MTILKLLKRIEEDLVGMQRVFERNESTKKQIINIIDSMCTPIIKKELFARINLEVK